MVITYVVLVCNGAFWHAALAGRGWDAPGTWGFALAMGVLLSGLYFLALALVSTRHTLRPLLSILLVLAAGCAWASEHYGIYFDRAMLRNMLATHWGEARELLGWSLASHVLVFGVLPAALVWWPRIEPQPWGRALVRRLAWAGGALVLVVGAVMPVFADFASLMRNNKEARHLVTPGNVIAAGIGQAWGRSQAPTGPRTSVGTDARLASSWQQRTRPTLFVLVVGETARAQNFSLNG